MPRVGFESTITAGERPQTYTLDRAATGTGTSSHLVPDIILSTIHSYTFIVYLSNPKIRIKLENEHTVKREGLALEITERKVKFETLRNIGS
jgi:hypothetical protein